MKFLLQILFIFLTWFTSLSAIPVFTKVALPSYEFSFSKTENATEGSVVKIGVQNFARSGIEDENQFYGFSKGEVWAGIACFEEEGKVVKGAGNYIKFLDDPAKASQFADEIIDINRATEGGGTLLSGSPNWRRHAA